MSNQIEYKETNLLWCPLIPKDWEVKKLKYVVDFLDSNRVPLSSDERGKLINRVYDYYGASGIIDKVENYIFDGTYILLGEDGANLITRSTELAFIATGRFWVNNHAHILEPREGNIYYFKNLLESYDYYPLISGSAQPKLTSENLANIDLPIPPIEVQHKIANFLDQKTTEIDNLISQKQKLIDCLKEERMAIINQAVTKGINPNAEMKESGIEWLGEIPKHWEVKKLKYILAEKLEYGANESALESNNENPRYLRISDFDEEGILRMDTFKSLPLEKAKDFLLKKGDILFARSGATVGKTFIFWNYEGIACFAGYLIKARPNLDVINPIYLYLYTKSNAYENWKNSIFNQSTIQNIGADKYCDLEVPMPKISEQTKIVSYIEIQTQCIDTTIGKIEQEIDLIKEYRTSLINEVVTGKKIIK